VLNPREFANKLAELFEDSFDNEPKGVYRIFREDLSRITGRPVLHQTIIEDVADWLVGLGLILIDRDSFFVIVGHDHFDSIRTVPGQVVQAHAHPIDFGSSK